MKASIIGALLGAVLGFTTVVILSVAVIQSGFLRAILFPGYLFIHFANRRGAGDFGQMIYDFFAYFTNILIYAVIGWLVGRALEARRAS